MSETIHQELQRLRAKVADHERRIVALERQLRTYMTPGIEPDKAKELPLTPVDQLQVKRGFGGGL